jgi:hypothetical protein
MSMPDYYSTEETEVNTPPEGDGADDEDNPEDVGEDEE